VSSPNNECDNSCKRRACEQKGPAFEWQDSQCYHYQVADVVCIPVKISQGVASISGSCGQNFALNVKFKDDTSEGLPTDLLHIFFELRSYKDPQIIADQITSGTFTFGRTVQENKRDGAILTTVGAISLFILFVVVPGIGLTVYFCFADQFDLGKFGKKPQTVRSNPPVSMPLSNPPELPDSNLPGAITAQKIEPKAEPEIATSDETVDAPPPAYTR
jgi:hypothetical protein